jgi:serine/threonine protein kinase/Tfp pilus assembly protein PilF
MTNWNPRANDLFLKALELRSDDERQKYLDEACIGDGALRDDVESLLEANARAGSFLESPVPASNLVAAVDGPSVSERPGTIIGPYKLLEQIGEGGFGVVFMAEQIQSVRRKVALKVLKPGMDTRQVIARFEAERQALALMDHPNIAKVLDAGETLTGRPYFVMDLVRGIPITEYCDQAQLPPRPRLDLFVSLCQAVQHAHQKGIIHRDLKPTNVLLTLQDGVPVVKVIDFGVAKAMGQQLTEKTLFTGFAQMLGTPLYMAPEQTNLSNIDVDTRCDIYSLGVLLYELLTGTTPFDKERLKDADYDQLRRIIREEEPPRPSTRISTLAGATQTVVAAQRKTDPKRLSQMFRGELDWIVMKALEKDRNRRYETASALAADVQRYLNDEPVLACPPSAVYRMRKFARRYKKTLSTAALFGVLLVLSAAISAWQAVRATLAERQARAHERQALEERDAKELARQAEAAQRQQAYEEAAIAKAVNEFLQKDLLGQADIANQAAGAERNRNLTVRELLDRAALAIEDKFKGQELTEAAIRQTLGDAYRALGEYPKAQEHLQRSLDLRQKRLGVGHLDTLISNHCLAFLYQQQGRYDAAEEIYKQVLEISRRDLPSDHPETLSVMNNLGLLYRSQGRYDEAEQIYKQALDGHRRVHAADHPEALVSANNLATVYWARARYEEAEPLFKQVLDATRRTLGADHPRTLGGMNNLGALYHYRGRLDEAELLYKQAADGRRAKLGADHPDTLISMGNLALVLKDRGRLDEAERLLTQVLQTSREKLGMDHSFTLNSMNSLAGLYWRRNNLKASVPLYEETLARQRLKLGADHPETLRTLGNLGVNYRDAGRLDDGLRCLEEALATARKRPGPLPRDLAWIPGALADTYDQAKRFDKAEAVYREWLQQACKQYGDDDPRVAAIMAQLGSSLLRRQKYADAEKTLRDCLAIRSNKEPDNWTTFSARSLLGGALLGQAKYADAEPLLMQGYAGMKEREGKIPEDARWNVTRALERLVQLYDAWGKPDKAAKWRKEPEAVRDKRKK